MAGELRLQLLGGLDITLDGQPVRGFLSSKVQALLCYLAVTGRPQPRETLMGLLWGDMPEKRANHGLRQALSNIQKLVGPRLVMRPMIAFNRDDPSCFIDIQALLSRLKEADSAPFGVHRHLREAVELYTGEFLNGFYVRDAPEFEEWMAGQREWLRTLAIGALQKLADHHAKRAEYALATDYLKRLIEMDPWREDMHRRLMLLFAYMGKPEAAVAQYNVCRQVLLTELGEEPTEETTALYKRIRAGRYNSPEISPAALGNVPREYAPLIGRQTELAQIVSLLADPSCRVLTLTGPGGIGKTRLALQVASDLANDFEDGVFFVSLADTADPALALGAIARTLRVGEAAGRTLQRSLEDALRGKELLLVLDNFEQLLSAAPLVGVLSAASQGPQPRLRVLVTSRARLRLRQERVYEVPPLALPGVQGNAAPEAISSSPAVAMFVERAQSSMPEFRLTGENAEIVTEICRKLDGLPLAIELAAARLEIMPVQSLLGRLENRLAVLTGGARDLPARQRTLRATIEWSDSLLAEPERKLFRALSVFAGGCTLDAVEAVIKEPRFSGQESTETPAPTEKGALDETTALVDYHLISREGQANGEMRFRMLETIRQYGLESLAVSGEEAATRRSHAQHYLGLACSARGEFTGPNLRNWLEKLETEHDNMRVALKWAVESNAVDDAELGLRAAVAIWRFWDMRGYLSEGRRWLEGLRAAGSATGMGKVKSGLWAQALHGESALAFRQGNLELAGELGESSLALFEEVDDKPGSAAALNNLGTVRRDQGEHERAKQLFEHSLALYRGLGDKRGMSAALNNMSAIAQREGDLSRAAVLYEESLSMRRKAGDAWGLAYTLDKLAEVERDSGNLDRAATLCEESLAIRRELRDRHGIAMSLTTLGTIETGRGNPTQALESLEDSLAIYSELGEIWGQATVLRALGVLARAHNDNDEAMRFFKESLRLYRENGDPQAVALLLAELDLMEPRTAL